ncbi:MAG TPA: glycoside hydrolase family 30 protein [Parafilimonas sp.]|nr:glycoside hydrolase family 30 protein [Parafilimonas sp.]
MKQLLMIASLFLFGTMSNAQSKTFSTNNKKVLVYTTADKTDDRISLTDSLHFTHMGQPVETQVCVFVDPSQRFQKLIGIGGALTDASAETFYKLPKDKQQELLKAYYDTVNGIGYNFARTNINSCDFSSDVYTYVADNDASLKTFNLAHDEKYKIPFIKEVMKAANNHITLFVSPWSPPAWMKENDNMDHGGKLKPQFMQSWANYYVKFIKGYEAKGIPIWGLTVQNEPMAKQTWESCTYTAEDERDFIKNFLGPTLAKDGLSNKKLMCWDHNRDLIYQRASTILEDPNAAKYVWGIGYHWYETWTGSAMEFDNVALVHQTFPTKNLVFTEGCAERFDAKKIHDWSLGEKYGMSMVHDFNNGTVAWTDWNILLDENGGPNHVGNFCFAPVHADTKTGELTYTNSYYYIGHFSKFIRPGAQRVIASSNRDKLQTTAFINTNGKLVVVVLNTSDEKIDYNLWIKGEAAQTTSLPHSIETLVVE